MRHTPIPIDVSYNKYLYNGKEQQDKAFDGGVRFDWYDYGARFYDPTLGRFHTMDPLTEKNHSQSGFVYAANNPIKYIDYMGLDTTVYILDQPENPNNKRVYTADIYVNVDGNIRGPYSGSSFPNDGNRQNTLNEGEYRYNNESGHNGGDSKGLNIVNGNGGERVAEGTNPEGQPVPDPGMTLVNVHSGVSPENDPAGLMRHNRGSAGCPTIHPSDTDVFYSNFDWSGSKGTTGNSTGTLSIQRGAKAEATKRTLLLIKSLQDIIPNHNTNPINIPYKN